MSAKGKAWEVPRDELQKVVDESDTINEVALKIGYITEGQSVGRAFLLRLRNDGIDLNGLKKRRSATVYRRRTGHITTEEMLASKKRNPSPLKERLLKDGILKNTCNRCGNDGNWNGIPLTLHLHHIDEDGTNNKLDNLELLCPNCHYQTHAQLEKLKSANRAPKCIDCGVRVGHKSTLRCRSCSAKEASKLRKYTEKIPIDDLRELIKTHSLAAIGKMYGVSSGVPRRLCIKYGIKMATKGFPRKYSDEVIASIRADTRSRGVIAAEYGMDRRYVWQIQKGRNATGRLAPATPS